MTTADSPRTEIACRPDSLLLITAGDKLCRFRAVGSQLEKIMAKANGVKRAGYRPRTTKQITRRKISLPDGDWKYVAKQAKSQGISQSEYLTRLVMFERDN